MEVNVREAVGRLPREARAILGKLARIELCRKDLGEYGKHVFGFPVAAHHEEWLEALQDEECKRLLIVAPPESMKSSWVSLAFASWTIGRNPWGNVVLVSATATQAETWGVANKEAIEESPKFREIWPDLVPNPRKGWGEIEFFVRVLGKDERIRYPGLDEALVPRPWLEGKRVVKENPHPTMISVGIGGPIMGKRANTLIIDDPHNMANTSTRHQRLKVITFLDKDAKSRLKPDGKWVIIVTRWHQHDAADYFMEQEGFRVIHVPALMDSEGKPDLEGESYWPGYWPRGKLLDRRGHTPLSKRTFQIMWQGEPIPEEGNLLRRETFMNVAVLPRPQYLIQSWDTAQKGEGQVDFSVCVTMGPTEDAKIPVEHVFRDQLSFPALKRKVIDQAEIYGPRAILIEDRGSGQNLIQVLQAETNLPIIAIKPGKRSKEVRAEPLAAYYEAGKILHPKNAPWLEDFEDELLAFPYGRYDDQVDAMSQGTEWIMEKTRKRSWARIF